MTEPIWTPDPARVEASRMHEFMAEAVKAGFMEKPSWNALYDWSVEKIEEFWPFLWEHMGVIASSKWDTVLGEGKMPGVKWFEGARLNFAENLLRYRDDKTALLALDEAGRVTRIRYGELHDLVARCAAALKRAGVKEGDRVAGFVPNIPHAVIAMLAATSLGAIWSSCSPDFGIQGVLDRFGQIEPKVLFTADAYAYNGKTFDSMGRIADLLRGGLGAVEQVVVIPFQSDAPDLSDYPRPVARWDDFLNLEDPEVPPLEFAQLPFDHPVYIMYSSGTTGVPKCIVHGAGGTLLQHLKELSLHTDVGRDDNLFYFTTCGWMMWNWLVSGLAVGATVFLFEGSPSHPDLGVLWKAAQDHSITVFGTSARYLAAVQDAGLKPGDEYDLSALRAICSTGSPLSVEQFHWIYTEVKSDLQLASISGGTDIISCFALGNPVLPVHEGELQCRGLGMAVEVWNDDGKPVVGEKGELVCVKSAPSMPISFWNDPQGDKYRGAYFDHWPGVWRHGDYTLLTERGGLVIYGRSDATLNPGGVRIGTAEIYRAVENMEEISDSLVVGVTKEGDVELILFVILKEGAVLDETLTKKIKTAIRTENTPRHVPRQIHAVADIPYTISGKKVELAVRNILHGREVKNRDALKNPEALDEYGQYRVE
jgi:acetoacetyl-CoA synthetase